MFSLQEFPVCCGAQVLTGWGWSNTNYNYRKPIDLKKANERLAELVECVAPSVGMFMVILEPSQIIHVEHLLLKHGFKVAVKDFYHPGHGNNLTLYVRINNPDKNLEFKESSFHGQDQGTIDQDAGKKKIEEGVPDPTRRPKTKAPPAPISRRSRYDF
jgi:hypothetical protein